MRAALVLWLAAASCGAAACGASSRSNSEGAEQASKTEELHAAEHREMAPELRAFDDPACRDVPPDARAECPLLGNVVGADDTDDSVILRLSLHAHPHEVATRVRCHLAFAAAHHHENMRKCPLYVPGVHLLALEQARTIELAVDDPSLREELATRVHEHAGW